MDELRTSESATRMGQIIIIPNDTLPLVDHGGRPLRHVTSAIYEWTPAPELKGELPPSFTFRLRCITGSDGVRRFYPVGSLEEFIAQAFMVGLALLSTLKHLTPEQRHSYRTMYLLFQRVRRSKEHLGNNLLNATSLRISRVGRDLADEPSILPATVGLDQQGGGEPWSVDRFLAEGRQAARGAGIELPSEVDCVHYGLVAAAKLNPLIIPSDRVSELVHQALYDEIPIDEPIQPEVVDAVIERTLAAMHHHLDEPAAEFDAWFSGPHASFVRQIAKRKLLPGGQLDQVLVRSVLVDLGWQAYRYVADCIHTTMWAIERSIPEPLTEGERTFFDQMYLNQPHFGNLPLVLLVERFPFVQSIIWDILGSPDDQTAIAVLHRLLDYYGDMARRRRQVDRTIKQRRPANLIEGEKTPLIIPLKAPVIAPETGETEGPNERPYGEPAILDSSPVPEMFDQIAEALCVRRQIRCKCGTADWDHRVLALDGVTATIEHACRACHFTAMSTVSVEEIKQHVLGAHG